MQYILTEKEYINLQQKNVEKIKEMQEIINELCIRVCDSELIKVDWHDDKIVWGCRYSLKHDHYCDCCPTQDYCTLSKHWSK